MSGFEQDNVAWPVWLTVLIIVSYGLFVWYVILLFFGDDEKPVDPRRSTVRERALRSVWAPSVLTVLFGYLGYAVFVRTLPLHLSFVLIALFFALSMGYFAYCAWRRNRRR